MTYSCIKKKSQWFFANFIGFIVSIKNEVIVCCSFYFFFWRGGQFMIFSGQFYAFFATPTISNEFIVQFCFVILENSCYFSAFIVWLLYIFSNCSTYFLRFRFLLINSKFQVFYADCKSLYPLVAIDKCEWLTSMDPYFMLSVLFTRLR